MIRTMLSIVLALCTLGAYAELVDNSPPSNWIKHEWPSDDFPVVYNSSIHHEDFYGGCSVYLWAGGTRMQVEGRDNRWHGKQLVQVVIFTKNADGSIAVSRPLPTETYVGEYDEKTGKRLPTKKGEESKYRLPLSLPVAGYDVFSERCMSEVATLPPDVLIVFHELYRPLEVK